jgi:hypothetical protein
MHKKKLRRAPLLIAAAVALPVMLGACGSSSSTSDAPSSAQGGSSSSAQAGAAQFAQCMRQNGVTNFPDPQNGRFLIGSDVQSNPHFQSAIQACQHFLGPGGIGSNSQNNGNQQAELAFAQCMQTHGVSNFPDPTAQGAIQVPAGVDPNSPTYQKAFNECRSKLPGNGNGLQG